MAKTNPWIKLHRKILNWGWYDDPSTRLVFFHILLSVNDTPGNWHGNAFEAGEFITSIRNLAKDSGTSIQHTRTALTNLQLTHEITVKSCKQFSLIKLNKWKDYQLDNDKKNTQPTHSQHTGTIQTNNSIKNKNKKLEVPKGTGDESQPKGDLFINNLIQEFDTVLELGGLWSDAVSSRRRYAHLIKTSRKWTPEQCAMLLRSAKIHPRHCNWSKMSDLYYRGVELIQEAKTKANKPFMAEIK